MVVIGQTAWYKHTGRVSKTNACSGQSDCNTNCGGCGCSRRSGVCEVESVFSVTNAREMYDTKIPKVVDLERVIKRVKKEHTDWSGKRLACAVEQYKRFLALASGGGTGEFSPFSPDMDEIWHNHILHTKEYMKCCEQLFGHYLHHTPTYTDGDREQCNDIVFELHDQVWPEDTSGNSCGETQA